MIRAHLSALGLFISGLPTRSPSVGNMRNSSTRWPCAPDIVRRTGIAFTGGPSASYAASSQLFGVSPWIPSRPPLRAANTGASRALLPPSPFRIPPETMMRADPAGADVAAGEAEVEAGKAWMQQQARQTQQENRLLRFQLQSSSLQKSQPSLLQPTQQPKQLQES